MEFLSTISAVIGRAAFDCIIDTQLMSNAEISTIWPQIVTGFFTIAGGLSSGIFVWLTSKKTLEEQRKAEIAQRKLEKLEELYILFEGWTNEIFSAYIFAAHRHKGHLTAKEVNDAALKRGERSKIDFNRLMMIVDMHFVDLKEPLDKVLEIRDKNSKYLLAKERLDLSEFFKNQRDFESRAKAFKEAITKISCDSSR